MFMRHIIESSVGCLVLPRLSTLSHTRQDFQGGGKGKSLNMKRVYGFLIQYLAETFLILRITERDIVKNV
jgi:hypothetical protein